MTPSPGRLALVGNTTDYRTVTPDGCAVLLDLSSLAVAMPSPDRLFGLFTEDAAEWPRVVETAALYNEYTPAAAVGPSGLLAVGTADHTGYNVRPSFIQDGPGPFPASVLATMPKWGLPLKELYQYKGETFADAQQRWLYEATALEAAWHYDLGAILQCYTMHGLYTVPQVEAIAAAGVAHLNARGPRWKVALTFAWHRADGGDIAALADLQSQIVLSSPGWPSLQPVEHPSPPVNDDFIFFGHKGVRP